MDTVIKIIGIVIVVISVVLLVKPDVMKRLLEFFMMGKRLYIPGLIRLALAVVFFLSARECDITWVIVVLGIIFLLSALLIFVLGPDKLRPMMDWYQRQSLTLLRIIAVLPLAIGAIIIYCA
jgi:uncharacterized protein YjeT (DUF2065 family)